MVYLQVASDDQGRVAHGVKEFCLNYDGQVLYHRAFAHLVARQEKLFFLLFIFILPFQRVTFVGDNLLGIQGLKPFNLLSAVVVAYLLFKSTPVRPMDKIEMKSMRIFLLYFATFTIAFIRSIPNAPLFHSRFPEVFPESYPDFILSMYVVSAFYVLPFLFILRRLCSFHELEKITTVICFSMLLLSVTFIILVLMNPSVLVSGNRDDVSELVSGSRNEMAVLCETYYGIHYNTIGTIYICTVPLLLYRVITRKGLWIVPLALSLVAVLLLQSRSALVTVALSCCLLLVQRRNYVILFFGAAVLGITAFLWAGPTIDALLSVGFQNSSDFSADAVLTGRVDGIWIPLLDEWTSDIGLFLFGAGRNGMITSELWYTGALFHAGHAHNALIDFFVDCGAIFTSVLIVLLFVGLATALRVGRKLDNDLYWALFICLFGFGIGMLTEREIFPTIDNMYVFPIVAMMINLARLRYRV
ncbi:hypothetical protein [Bradyrhizobium sp. Tv2a-2]|uniref:O-antigen ligase family protein n=1 Tax=Bradyrhizobium sp. Tv2a-2 TaxID=113395 RepID=UPI000561E056|nr:hypothetical protein [Bradyrhizobium sp. Tv2a-2]